jgi:hypothetical protein
MTLITQIKDWKQLLHQIINASDFWFIKDRGDPIELASLQRHQVIIASKDSQKSHTMIRTQF